MGIALKDARAEEEASAAKSRERRTESDMDDGGNTSEIDGYDPEEVLRKTFGESP